MEYISLSKFLSYIFFFPRKMQVYSFFVCCGVTLAFSHIFFPSFTMCAVLSVLGNSRLIHFLFSKPSYHTWAPLPPACSCSTASDLQGLQNGKTLFTLTSLMPTENFILHFCADSGELGTAFKKCT